MIAFLSIVGIAYAIIAVFVLGWQFIVEGEDPDIIFAYGLLWPIPLVRFLYRGTRKMLAR